MKSFLATLGLKMPDYVFEIGVITEKTKRKKIQLGVTNAELMFIHENGSPLRNLPARPVLEMTIEWANSSGELEKVIDAAFEILVRTGDISKIDILMKKFAIKLQNYARNIIISNDGRLAANAPSTIKAKGDNYPLHNTGQLARSITCRAFRIEGGKLV